MREGYEIYEAYLDGHEKEIEEEREFIVEVRDLAQLCRKVLKARVSRRQSAFPQGCDLWIRNYKEELQFQPWSIAVIEEMDDDMQPVRGDMARGILPSRDDKIY